MTSRPKLTPLSHKNDCLLTSFHIVTHKYLSPPPISLMDAFKTSIKNRALTSSKYEFHAKAYFTCFIWFSKPVLNLLSLSVFEISLDLNN